MSNFDVGQDVNVQTEEEQKRQRRNGTAAVKTVILSERDLQIFEWIAEHRFSTKALVLERFYSEAKVMRAGTKHSGQYGALRLKQLEKQAYIRPSKYRVQHQAMPLVLTEVGYKLLHGMGRILDFKYLSDIDIENFEHECWTQRLRIQFEKDFGCKSWATERTLKILQQDKQLPYLPDGRFYSIHGQAWNLEIERTAKRSERLKELLHIRAQSSKKSRVLYVLDRRFSEFYRNLMAITVNPSCFYITHFDDLSTVYCGDKNWVAENIKQTLQR